MFGIEGRRFNISNVVVTFIPLSDISSARTQRPPYINTHWTATQRVQTTLFTCIEATFHQVYYFIFKLLKNEYSSTSLVEK